MVVDTRETWKQFINRVWNFKPAPLVERTELPPEKQPNRTIYGKLACFLKGIDPNPPPRPLAEVSIASVAEQSKNAQKYEIVDTTKVEDKKEEPAVNVEEVDVKKFSLEEKKEDN